MVTGRRASPLARGSLQAAARELRYRFLEEVRVRHQLPFTALGHTADDVVEGVLLNLIRGAGLAGMRGMPACRGPYRRPLLDTWRSEIEEFLEARRVEPIRDPSNLDQRFARVRVRTHLLPDLERSRPGIGRRIRSAARAASVYQERLEQAAREIEDGGGLRLDRLGASPATVRIEALRRLYGAALGHRPGLGRRHLEAMDRLVLHGSAGQGLDLPGAMRIRRGYTCVEMIAMDDQRPPTMTLLSHACAGCSVPAAAHFAAGHELTVGRRRPGLRMRPLPGGHSRKLQDILVDAKIPRHHRDELALVFADGELAWVPGIALDSRFAARPGEPGVHAELAGAQGPSARIQSPTQGVFPQ
ncbi:MAG: tRNA lysidine(34) synthetase TilS [Candidatus Dormibacteraceae bacterium]